MKQGLHRRHYSIHEVVPYINWVYFFHAWGFQPKFAATETFSHCYSCELGWIKSFPTGEEQEKAREAVKLYKDAKRMLFLLDANYETRGNVWISSCNSRGNDLLLYNGKQTEIIPLLRQQSGEPPYLCLSDFIRPKEQGEPDTIAVFATTVDDEIEKLYPEDEYKHLMAQTLADRLAEATAEKLHEEVRKSLWAYAPDEKLTPHQMNNEEFQGIRPAIGYPSLPDISLNRVILPLVDAKQLGIRLTEHAMMQPHASVSGFMIAHPKSRYFSIGKIGEDQLEDYAKRRNATLNEIKTYLSANL